MKGPKRKEKNEETTFDGASKGREKAEKEKDKWKREKKARKKIGLDL